MRSTALASVPIKVKVLVFKGGGGHYATYQALRVALRDAQPSWHLSHIFLDAPEQKEHSASERSAEKTSFSSRFYDFALSNGFSWLHLATLHLHKVVTAFNRRSRISSLAKQWQQDPPDLLLSVVPFHNEAIAQSAISAQLSAPVVTVLTDLADSPPAYWFAPHTSNHVICPTNRATEQAIAQGIPQKQITQTSGLPIHTKFYKPPMLSIEEERTKLGLSSHCKTGLVCFGSNGSNEMLNIAQRLAPMGERLQLIFLCGRNDAIAQKITSFYQTTNTAQKWATVGFTSDVEKYMFISDFFIGKPGNVSISEAVAMDLPLIVERNWLTLPQERYAADWIVQQQIGLAVSSFKSIDKAVETLLQADNFARYQCSVSAIDNRAIFEIVDFLSKLVEPRILAEASR